MEKLLAQNLHFPGGQIQGPATLKTELQTLPGIVTFFLPIIFSLAGFILFIFVIYSGFDFLLSRGNAEKVSRAQGRLVAGLIGFIIIFVAYWLTQLLKFVFGI